MPNHHPPAAVLLERRYGARHLNGRCPASTVLVAQSLARPELLVEIEAIAVLGG